MDQVGSGDAQPHDSTSTAIVGLFPDLVPQNGRQQDHSSTLESSDSVSAAQDPSQKKTHRRSATVIKVAGYMMPTEQGQEESNSLIAESSGYQTDGVKEGLLGVATSGDGSYHGTEVQEPLVVDQGTLPAAATDNSGQQKATGHGEEQTIPDAPNGMDDQLSNVDIDTEQMATSKTLVVAEPIPERPESKALDVLSYLDPDSPNVTRESIYNSMRSAAKRPALGHVGQNHSGWDSDSSSSEPPNWITRYNAHDGTRDSSFAEASSSKSIFTTPPSTRRRSNVSRPQLRSSESTPRVGNRGGTFPGRRPAQMPVSGYELLASHLAAPSFNRPGPQIRPMYRRFEALNHRLLLHLQDEIAELEEQLKALDTSDTQSRWVRDREHHGDYILPASRRAEFLSGDELGWARTDLLGRVGFKLEQYNRILASFRGTSSLPKPSTAEVHEYRGFLSSQAPIAEVETHFLDNMDDLIAIEEDDSSGPETNGNEVEYGDLSTPMPRNIYEGGVGATESANDMSRSSSPTVPGFEISRPTTSNAHSEADTLSKSMRDKLVPTMFSLQGSLAYSISFSVLVFVVSIYVLGSPKGTA